MPKITGKKKKLYYSILWKAVKSKNVNEVEKLLKTRAKVDEECGKDCGTVLHLAAKIGSLKIVKMLLKNGADVKKRDRFGNNPLHVGASNKLVALELIKHNAKVNAKNSLRETPLHFAQSKAVVEQMILKGVDLNIRDRYGKTVLFKTSCKNIMETLLIAGANVNQECGKNVQTVLHIASERGYTELVKILLKYGADINKINRFGNTPLHRGAIHEGVALELIKHNANVNAKNALCQTPLHFTRSVVVLEGMIARGIDLNSQDINGETVLYSVTKECYMWSPKSECLIRSLVAAGANVNQECGKPCETVLHLAAQKGLLELVKFLLENGADVNKKDKFGNAPIHRGAFNEKVALELIKYNADVNVINTSKETPLHFAGSAAVVKSMLARGACLDALDINGETPLFRAAKRPCEGVLKSILKAGANLNQRCGYDLETALHYAAKCGSKDAVKLLLQYGANVNKRDIFGNTPLHTGASKECIVLELLQHNANVIAKNRFGEIPIHYAGSEFIFNRMVRRLPDHAHPLTVETYTSFLRKTFLISEWYVDGKYEKTVSVDKLGLKRVCIINNGENSAYFKIVSRVYPLLEFELQSSEFHVNPPSYCSVLQAAKRQSKPMGKSSNIITSSVKIMTQEYVECNFPCAQLYNTSSIMNVVNESHYFEISNLAREKYSIRTNFTSEHETELLNDAKEEWYRKKEKRKFKQIKKESLTPASIKSAGRKQKAKQDFYRNVHDIIIQMEWSIINNNVSESHNFETSNLARAKYSRRTNFTSEHETELRNDAKEEWYREQEKRKFKQIKKESLTPASIKNVGRKQKTKQGFYKNVREMIVQMEWYYYNYDYFADLDAKDEFEEMARLDDMFYSTFSNRSYQWPYKNPFVCRYQGPASQCLNYYCTKHSSMTPEQRFNFLQEKFGKYSIDMNLPMWERKQKRVRKRRLRILSIELPRPKV